MSDTKSRAGVRAEKTSSGIEVAVCYLETIAGFDSVSSGSPGCGRGMLRAIEQGYVQREIEAAAYAYQREVEAGNAVVVGVNRFVSEGTGVEVPTQRIDEGLERRQVERVKSLHARRDQARWKASVQAVEDAARSGDNVMPRILEAVESNATVGEITDAMRRVFGEFREAVVF